MPWMPYLYFNQGLYIFSEETVIHNPIVRVGALRLQRGHDGRSHGHAPAHAPRAWPHAPGAVSPPRPGTVLHTPLLRLRWPPVCGQGITPKLIIWRIPFCYNFYWIPYLFLFVPFHSILNVILEAGTDPHRAPGPDQRPGVRLHHQRGQGRHGPQPGRPGPPGKPLPRPRQEGQEDD